MKKIFALALTIALTVTTAMAQAYKGDIAAGVNLNYGSKIENLGLGAKFQYTIIDHLRAEVGFNYFFKKNYESMWDANLNAQYLINVYQEKLYLYPIVGLNFSSLSFDEKGFNKEFGVDPSVEHDDINRIGLNLGAGAQYQITERIGLSLEYRHTILKDIDQGVFSLGASYKF